MFRFVTKQTQNSHAPRSVKQLHPSVLTVAAFCEVHVLPHEPAAVVRVQVFQKGPERLSRTSWTGRGVEAHPLAALRSVVIHGAHVFTRGADNHAWLPIGGADKQTLTNAMEMQYSKTLHGIHGSAFGQSPRPKAGQVSGTQGASRILGGCYPGGLCVCSIQALRGGSLSTRTASCKTLAPGLSMRRPSLRFAWTILLENKNGILGAHELVCQ